MIDLRKNIKEKEEKVELWTDEMAWEMLPFPDNKSNSSKNSCIMYKSKKDIKNSIRRNSFGLFK